jgi:hypothetical protein
LRKPPKKKGKRQTHNKGENPKENKKTDSQQRKKPKRKQKDGLATKKKTQKKNKKTDSQQRRKQKDELNKR